MKLKKKIICIATAVVYAVSFCAGTMMVSGEEAATLSISSEEGVPGETVYVYVDFNADSNLYVCGDIDISYDGELYASGAGQVSNNFSIVSAVFDNVMVFAGYSTSDNGVPAGTFAQIPFTIPSDAEPGTVYDITFSDVSFIEVVGENGVEDITCNVTFVNGCITVIEETPVKYEDLLYRKVDDDSDGAFDYIEITSCDRDVTKIVIPEKIDGLPVTSIDDEAFLGCYSLKSLSIPNGVTSIGNGVFWYCSDLTSIEIPSSVTSIGNRAFENCTSLTSIEIPNSVKTIGDLTFCNCSGLESITLPDSIMSIGEAVITGCGSLASITIENPKCVIAYNSICDIYEKGTVFRYYTGIIRGYEDSTAQAYAEKYGCRFESLDGKNGIPGDANGDGETTVADAVEMQKYLTKFKTITKETLKQLDLNNDGKFNVFDWIILKRKIINASK